VEIVRVLILAVAAYIFALGACGGTQPGDHGDWNLPDYTQTGITPELGEYIIYDENGDYHISFEVAVDREGQRYVYIYGRYTAPIVDGSFKLKWGQIGFTHCPNDSVGLSGHFLSPTEVEGVIKKAFACDIYSIVFFNTSLN